MNKNDRLTKTISSLNNKKLLLTLVLITAITIIAIVAFFGLKQNQESIVVKQKISNSTTITSKLGRLPNGSGEASLPFPLSCVSVGISTKKVNLYGDFYAIASIICKYLDSNEKQQTILIPVSFTNKIETIIAGFKKREYDPRMEEFSDEAFWESLLSKVGYTGDGHIMYPAIRKPNENEYGSFAGFGLEVIDKMYTEEQLILFINTGDPKHLNGILWVSNIGMINGLNNLTVEDLSTMID